MKQEKDGAMPTRSEILAARWKVVKYLQDPKRRKVRGMLSNGWGRCCIGHACVAIGINVGHNKQNKNDVKIYFDEETSCAPRRLIDAVGLWSNRGTVGDVSPSIVINDQRFTCLTAANDSSRATTQQIGAYLESVIEGGVDTPWKHLSLYQE